MFSVEEKAKSSYKKSTMQCNWFTMLLSHSSQISCHRIEFEQEWLVPVTG